MSTYYVLHLREHEIKPDGKEFEVQLVDAVGATVAFGLIAANENHLEFDGEVVPTAVLDSAKKLPLGKGDFVDSMGKTVHPRDFS